MQLGTVNASYTRTFLSSSGSRRADNSVLQPVAGDWRDRLKARAAVPAEAEEQPQQSSSKPKAGSKAAEGKPDLAELGKGLPKGWRALWDPKQAQVYYGNARTKVGSCTGLLVWEIACVAGPLLHGAPAPMQQLSAQGGSGHRPAARSAIEQGPKDRGRAGCAQPKRLGSCPIEDMGMELWGCSLGAAAAQAGAVPDVPLRLRAGECMHLMCLSMRQHRNVAAASSVKLKQGT